MIILGESFGSPIGRVLDYMRYVQEFDLHQGTRYKLLIS